MTKAAVLDLLSSFGLDYRVNYNPNTDRGSDSKVHFVLTHAGLFVLTCVCLHLLVSNLLECLHDVDSTSEYFYDFIFFISAALRRRMAPENHQTFLKA